MKIKGYVHKEACYVAYVIDDQRTAEGEVLFFHGDGTVCTMPPDEFFEKFEATGDMRMRLQTAVNSLRDVVQNYEKMEDALTAERDQAIKERNAVQQGSNAWERSAQDWKLKYERTAEENQRLAEANQACGSKIADMHVEITGIYQHAINSVYTALAQDGTGKTWNDALDAISIVREERNKFKHALDVRDGVIDRKNERITELEGQITQQNEVHLKAAERVTQLEEDLALIQGEETLKRIKEARDLLSRWNRPVGETEHILDALMSALKDQYEDLYQLRCEAGKRGDTLVLAKRDLCKVLDLNKDVASWEEIVGTVASVTKRARLDAVDAQRLADANKRLKEEHTQEKQALEEEVKTQIVSRDFYRQASRDNYERARDAELALYKLKFQLPDTTLNTTKLTSQVVNSTKLLTIKSDNPTPRWFVRCWLCESECDQFHMIVAPSSVKYTRIGVNDPKAFIEQWGDGQIHPFCNSCFEALWRSQNESIP